jgi:hypothetical protein
MMKLVISLALVAACSGAQQPKPDPDPKPADTRSAIEKRRDTACEALGPRITACAVEDAKKDVASGKVTQAQFDQDASPDVQHKNSAEFIKDCESHAYSSRQVRVLEVCPQAETVCDPMLACLDNINPKQ